MVAPLIRGLGRFASGFDFPPPPRFRPRPPITQEVAGLVEPPIGLEPVRRALPNPDPQDVAFLNPRLETPPPSFPPFPQPIPFAIQPPTSRIAAPSFETRLNPSTYVPEYTPLQAQDIRLVQTAIEEDPAGTVWSAVEMLADSRNTQQFGRALEVAALSRAAVRGSEDALTLERVLDTAVSRAAKRFGISEEVYNPVLYKNSRDIPEDVRAAQTDLPTQEQVRATYTQSDEFRVSTNKAINSTKRVDDLDEFDTKQNGVIERALTAGEIDGEDAFRLVRQTNYRRIRLLQEDGILPKSLKNDLREKGGQRGIDLLQPTILIGTDARKFQIYKAALQTAESSDEVSQVYVLALSDITSPAYLDKLDDVMNAKSSLVGRIEGLRPARLAGRMESTIDEGSVRSANRAQIELDEARFEADRPENQGPIVRRMVRNPETGEIQEEVTGTVSSRRFDYSNTPGGAEGNPGRSPLPMWMSDGYVDPDGIVYRMRPENRGKTTMELIFAGKRTATTRDNAWKVRPGDVLDFAGDDGVVARVVVTKAPYQLPAPSSPEHFRKLSERWSELEGWDPSLYENMIGKWQFQYSLL